MEMSAEAFERLVTDELDLLPDEMVDGLDNVVFVVEDEPENGEELFGVYDGIAATERGQYGFGELPDRIVVFRKQHLAECDTVEELKDELLSHPEVQAWFESLWGSVKRAMLDAAGDPDSELRVRVTDALRALCERLVADDELQAKLDDWLERHEELALRVVVPAALRWEVRDKLDQANITERVLFPGLDGLSRWLRRQR